ncbi:hypothetical protein D7V93_02875 [Corallococcus llansteffanensis]|uniref:Immunity protein 52 domain-containing protein n=1 Tax=Corallococcus llansteffanensis TaxID=2316731 RepID=A0A3A8QFM4_9BACT|nr:hypothetical protein D7V93_02875 [Corallococcus llansteffanensis]
MPPQEAAGRLLQLTSWNPPKAPLRGRRRGILTLGSDNLKGTLIVLTPERFTVCIPEHVALARRVRELLAGAGLMPSMTR